MDTTSDRTSLLLKSTKLYYRQSGMETFGINFKASSERVAYLHAIGEILLSVYRNTLEIVTLVTCTEGLSNSIEKQYPCD
jgi:hypothetical protein